MAFSKTDQQRITFLSLLSTYEGDYEAAQEVLAQMETDGFFEGNESSRSSERRPRSGGRGSSSRSSNRGGNRRDDGGFSGLKGEATIAQINKIIELSDGDYSFDELKDYSKQDASDLIGELMNG